MSDLKLNRDISLCTELAWDTRAGDDHISLHDEPNDDLALLVGMIRLDQLFNIYYSLTSYTVSVSLQFDIIHSRESLSYKGTIRWVATSLDTYKY